MCNYQYRFNETLTPEKFQHSNGINVLVLLHVCFDSIYNPSFVSFRFNAQFKNCCGIHKNRISAYTIGNLSNYIDIRRSWYLSNFQLLHVKKHPVFSISISNGLQAMLGYKHLRGIKQWNHNILNDIIWKSYS